MILRIREHGGGANFHVHGVESVIGGLTVQRDQISSPPRLSDKVCFEGSGDQIIIEISSKSVRQLIICFTLVEFVTLCE